MHRSHLLLAASILLPSCSGEVTPPTPAPLPTPPVLVVSVGPSGVAVLVGTTLQMSATSPQLPMARWTWVVNDTSLAGISDTGLLELRRVGLLSVLACVVPPPAACGVATLTIVSH